MIVMIPLFGVLSWNLVGTPAKFDTPADGKCQRVQTAGKLLIMPDTNWMSSHGGEILFVLASPQCAHLW